MEGEKVKINGINGGAYFNPDLNNNNVKRNTPDNENVQKDKIEISSKAKELNKIYSVDKDLSKIKERIDSKYYDSDQVISKVADLVLKDIAQQ